MMLKTFMRCYSTLPRVHPSTIAGLHYVSNFLSQHEQNRIMDIIDSRPFANAIHRRQQFYGETYYHTTHHLAVAQPVDASSGVQ